MPSFLVKNMPPSMHERLRREAARHHRSMNREIIAILEKELGGGVPEEIPPPSVPSRPVSAMWVRETVRMARSTRR